MEIRSLSKLKMEVMVQLQALAASAGDWLSPSARGNEDNSGLGLNAKSFTKNLYIPLYQTSSRRLFAP
jgi:hypothetical protein